MAFWPCLCPNWVLTGEAGHGKANDAPKAGLGPWLGAWGGSEGSAKEAMLSKVSSCVFLRIVFDI
jgi:hypothetical protein